eukprot:4126602-Pleurochrysis_carterae.AAC.2
MGRGGLSAATPSAMKYARTSTAAQSQGRRNGDEVTATASASDRSRVECDSGWAWRSVSRKEA